MPNDRYDTPNDPADPPHAGHSQPIGTIEPHAETPDEPPPLAPRPLPRSKVPGASSGAPAPDPANNRRSR